ncbi:MULTISPECIES: alpha/beta fold hydrolase [Dickeya]|uniref:Alpha/beta hydrolase family protein n=1 Tax=Dickeya oryzae TaxID=1240404 RepID=A0AB39IM41_9GAMM|nr:MULTISPECIES: alpha/beta fold hydrolase [Dickeya]MCA6996361.1 alpha/beta fold hydrolase [Dickeya oryzae]MCO7261722.1 alpha/beta fold hydrolase [Dickeya zeae]
MLRQALFLLSVLLFSIQVQAYPGFRLMTLSDPKGEPLNVAVWYPTPAGEIMETVGENPAFIGVPVIRNAPPLSGEHPLLVISHGYNGSWRSLSWIAHAMAMQGYIVAAPDHPGTTIFNQNPVEAKKLWKRPRDIARVIDSVINAPELFGKIDNDRIAALGHSLGGWTVMSLAGARFDPARLLHDCQQYPQRGDCKLTENLGINDASAQEKLSADYRDARIRAVVSLDLGLAPGFTPHSLRDINIPVLILAARDDRLGELPFSQESGYIAAQMSPQWSQFHTIDGATHFSFMQLCKTGAEQLIDEDSPGNGIVCRDGNGASRTDIHKELVREISSFLNLSLNYHVPAGEIK